jgi:hypothetical protein
MLLHRLSLLAVSAREVFPWRVCHGTFAAVW